VRRGARVTLALPSPSSREREYCDFWLRYLRAHADPCTRALHIIGTSLALVCLVCAAVFRDWRFVPAAPVIGYSFAWGAHFGVGHNRPETFGHPFWSLFSDVRMLVLFLSGRLAPQLVRAGLP